MARIGNMFSSLFATLCLICQAHSATLLRGGTFITYSESTSNLEIITDGAMLFNDTIIAISGTIDGLDSHSSDTDVQTVNTTGKIISPGFIDTHRHTWQTAMRTLGPNVQLENYGWLFGTTGPAPLILSPDDIYIASLMGTLEALNAGVTTSSRFRAHDMDTGAFRRSPPRLWWCYNIGSVVISGDPYTVNTSAPIDQLAHIRELAPDSPFNNQTFINVVTTHYVNGLTPDPGPTWNSSLAARCITDTVHRHPILANPRQAALGVDTHFTFSIDMIGQMRIWLQSTRLGLYQETLDRFKIPSNTPMTVRQAFLLGTRNGGLALKQPDLGVLRVGAKADVLVFSTDAIGLVGWSDPVAAVVLHSNVADIEDIYVDGQLVKKGGKLVVDWQGEGFADRLKESGIKFRDALARTNITPFEVGLKGSLTDQDFQDPFQVDVTRGGRNGILNSTLFYRKKSA
ncbi:amidohydrolase family protein [Mycena olivaceomarginata]|nr:amidohydrolase family protein [Mycena olivaceomarginata]